MLGGYMTAKWTEADEIYLINNWGELDKEEIAEYLNRTPSAIQKKKEKLNKSGKYGNHPAPEFPNLPDPDTVTIDEYFQALDAVQTLRLKSEPIITSAEIRIPTNGKPIAFSPTSCWHMGGMYTFYEGFRERMNEVLEIDRFYWGAHGDEIENFPPNWAGTVFNNLIPPNQQRKLVAKIIDRLHQNGKLLYSMWSNHPAFSERLTGENPMEIIYKNKVPYFAGKGLVKLYVDNELYILSVAHLFRGHSQWNPNHAQRKQFDNIPQADFVIMGDKHTYSYQEMMSKGEAYDAGLQNNRTVHLVQTGTAKSLNDPYTVRWWCKGNFIWPTFVLSAKEHKIAKVTDTAALQWYLDRDDF